MMSLMKHHKTNINEAFHMLQPNIYTFDMLVHLQNFICSICNKAFARNGSLRSHLRTHTKSYVEKQHGCSICGKRFSISYSLNKHMLIHTGERPYSCHLCSKVSKTFINQTKTIKIAFLTGVHAIRTSGDPSQSAQRGETLYLSGVW